MSDTSGSLAELCARQQHPRAFCTCVLSTLLHGNVASSRAAERAAIVAWIRANATHDGMPILFANSWANAIERGEHRKGET